MNLFVVFLTVFQCFNAVKYEAQLEDGTLVSKSDGVEFTVGAGSSLPPSNLCVVNFNVLFNEC